MELEKIYNPDSTKRWYQIWEEAGYFKPTYQDGAESYCIVLPPPNVTGTLHMGHGFQHTIMDILTRYHRMRGFNTLWQPGTDHAGIATQIVVERQLEQAGKSRKELGRSEFVKRVWEWKAISGNTITNQMRRLGVSCDWSRERFTMDEGLSRAVTEVFVRLYEKGYIYRGNRLVNWDVKLQTAVSDLEVVSVEEDGKIWHIRYPLKDSNESLVVATTRPETMLGDMAVAVNPDDERYQHLIGKMVILPLSGREIPIIADNYVDITFGTGCVKITPAHDFNDYAVAKRHNLEMFSILTLDGHINDNAPKQYCRLERFAARSQVVSDLEALGLLVAVKPHTLTVPRSERTGVVVEPMLTNQWFMAMEQLAHDGLLAVDNKDVEFIPDNWITTYKQWLENIQDWCISRQLWWGHRIPAYYDQSGKFYVARNLNDAIAQAGTDKLAQDEDVLDTWFSSALWSFSTLGWPDDTQDLTTFLPTSVLVTGFDIIFFWVARMIMLTREFTGKVPFNKVYITGLIQDADGNKMSKSKGNIIDPIDLVDGISLDNLVTKRTQNLLNPKQATAIDKQTRSDYPEGFAAFGADSVRFTFASLATYGREIRFDVKRIEGSRNFCNKLWNAARFVLMNAQMQPEAVITGEDFARLELSLIDTWILSRLQQVVIDAKFAYETYRFDILAQKLYEFVWDDYCNWYLELAKVTMGSDNRAHSRATINTLLSVLECVLRLIHPLMPFISEELWQVVAPLCGKKVTPSIMLAPYPQEGELGNFAASAGIMSQVELLQHIVVSIRNLRATSNLNPGVKVPLIIVADASDTAKLDSLLPFIMSLAKISEVEFSSTADTIADVAGLPKTVVDRYSFILRVTINKDEERVRINGIIAKYSKELEKLTLQLDNPSFTARAPKDIVEQNCMRAKELSAQIKLLNTQLAELG